MATHLVSVPHEFTLENVEALRRFHDPSCVYTSQLVDSIIHQLPPGIDQQGIVGGFATCILISKVPGEHVVITSSSGRPQMNGKRYGRLSKKSSC